MEKHTVLFWFLSDLFHQFLFYFGGVVAMGILIWEKWREKPVQWKWIGAFFLFCLFVSCFQAFVDEHHNSDVLMTEKAQVVSDKNDLQQKLDAKQAEADYLRDHQQIHIDAGSTSDPRIALILDRLNKSQELSKTQPSQEIRRTIIALTREMLDSFEKQKAISDAMDNKIQQQRSAGFSAPFNPKDPAQMQRMQTQWQAEMQQEVAASMQMEANLRGVMMADYSPRAVALLEQIQTRGESQSGISDTDLQQAINNCTTLSAGSAYWGIQKCAERLSVIAQKMH
jgi:hypothetical protein